MSLKNCIISEPQSPPEGVECRGVTSAGIELKWDLISPDDLRGKLSSYKIHYQEVTSLDLKDSKYFFQIFLVIVWVLMNRIYHLVLRVILPGFQSYIRSKYYDRIVLFRFVHLQNFQSGIPFALFTVRFYYSASRGRNI